MEKLVIDRERWLHGEGCCESYLLRSEDKKMCCLGFYAQQKGYSVKEITDILTPDDLRLSYKKLPMLVDAKGESCSKICCGLMNTNDDDDICISDKERERRIAALFKKIGVAVRFKGRYSK